MGVYYYSLNISNEFDMPQVTLPPVKPKITVLANSIDLDLATDFIAFLKDRGIDVESHDATDFEAINEDDFIVILGGPDASESVGEIVQEVLTENEENTVREAGAKKMFVKQSVWADGQKVIVFAGADRNLTAAAHLESRDSLLSEIDIE